MHHLVDLSWYQQHYRETDGSNIINHNLVNSNSLLPT